jgi:cell wall-associated NlpC family hydrolase
MTAAERAAEEALAWVGTPFAHGQASLGHGVDCVQLAGQAFLRAGAVESYDFGAYTLDWSARSTVSLIDTYVEGTGLFERVAPGTARAGDLVCFEFGRCANHCGVALGPREFVHAMARRRVKVSRLDDAAWARRWSHSWRLLQ